MWGVPKLAIWVSAAVFAAIVGGLIAWQTQEPSSQPVKTGVATVDQAAGSAPHGVAPAAPAPAETSNFAAIATPSPAPPATASAAPPTTAAATPPATAAATSPATPADSGPVVVKPSPSSKPVSATLPQFDVVRVGPDGSAVIAGRAEPNAAVALLDRGQEIDHTTADDAGQFAMLPKQLDHGDHVLSLRMTTKDHSSDSAQNVAVWIPSTPKGEVLVALTNPGQPTQILSDAPKPMAAPSDSREATPPTPLAIRSAEAEAQGSFYATGFAPPGARVVLYLNNAYIASVTAGGDNRWSLKVEKGMKPGQYTIRADEVESSSGKVIARAEAPFNYPGPPAPAQNSVEVSQNPTPTPEPPATGGVPAAGSPPSVTRSKPPPSQPTTSAPAEPAEAIAKAGAHGPPVGPTGQNGTSAAKVASILPPSGVAPSGVSGGPSSDSSAPKNEPGGKPQTPVTASTANAVIGEVGTATVERGDSLWRISRKIYGSGMRYTQIYEANAKQIRNPNRIYPGQIFVVPNRIAN
jgi:nucleoid-associated protein YgaU